MAGWIHVEGKVWNKDTCETRRYNHIVAGNRDADYILKDIEFGIRDVDEKLKKEGTSDPEIEISFYKDDLKNCLDAVKKQGQEEVWEMIRRMYLDTEDTMEAYTLNEMDKTFGTYNLKSILNKPLEKMLEKDRKLREEVKARNAIKVGDFITYDSPLVHYEGWVLTEPALPEPVFKPAELRVDVLTFKDGIPEVVSVEINKCEVTGKRNPYVAAMMKSLETEKGET